MKVWLLIKKTDDISYENNRLKETAEKLNISLEYVFPDDFEIIVTKEGWKSILYNDKPVELPDFLIPRRGSSSTYFTLAIIRHLEKLGVNVINTVNSIEISKDKLASMQVLASNNIPIPQTMLAKFPVKVDMLSTYFKYPIIVKTLSGTQGKGVFLCETKSRLGDLMDLLENSIDPKTNLVFQEFISSSRGRDIRVIVIGGRPIGAILRKAKGKKYKANYSAGGKVEKFDLNPEIEWLAAESAKLMDLDIAGVDILFDGDHYKICEVNSSPGFKGFEEATGIDVPTEIFNYLKVRFEGISLDV